MSTKHSVALLVLLSLPTWAANYTVKAGGGGNYTTIQACANAIGNGDTCTVYAGTYNENVTVPAGAANQYKTITVNGSDIVTVQSFTMGSHTKLIGNCPTPTAGNTPAAGSCGFTITYPSAPSSRACVSANASTDVYIKGNVMYECGSGAQINAMSGASYVYIQGNTLAYACTTPATATTSKNCNSMLLLGNHFLVENNDISHYTLGIDINASYSVYRNNIAHDQFETEAGGNSHSDWWFSEPGNSTYPAEYNVIEGNFQYNAVGANAKGILAQGDTQCGGVCYNIIERFNTTSRVGSGYNSNNGTADWPRIKIYNNTIVDTGYDLNLTYGDADNNEKSTNGAFLNQIYYFTQPSINEFNVYSCGSTCTQGYNLYWCTGTCTNVRGHTYGVGSFTAEPGNLNANPLFVNYTSLGSLSNDYRLQSTSPARGAGTFLTTVAAGDSGSGTSLVVNDVAYFQDGYGLSNAYSTVSPDCIAVGTAANHVCITSINYATNTLTLTSSISRSAGQGVYLYSKSDGVQVLTGSAPDMGAYPYGDGACAIAPSSVGPFTATQAVSVPFSVSGTCTSSTFGLTAGSLTGSGLSLNAACSVPPGTGCTLTGTAAAGGFAFTVGYGTQATDPLSLTINAVPSISTTTLPDGVRGSVYSQALSTTGGTGAITCAVTSASLPPGLTLTGCTITGTPQ